MEEMFLSCVDEVRKDVVRRRASNHRIPANMREVLHAADKRKILESFITREEVISLLYDHLFPVKTESPAESRGQITLKGERS